MRINWHRYWWYPGFTLAFIAMGLPYWQIPYSKVNLPDALLGAGLVVLFAASAVTRMYSGKSLLRVVMVIGSAVPAVVMARVSVEVAFDPSTHNLWPFECVIAMLVGVAAALPGALLGSLVRWLARRRGGDDAAR